MSKTTISANTGATAGACLEQYYLGLLGIVYGMQYCMDVLGGYMSFILQ